MLRGDGERLGCDKELLPSVSDVKSLGRDIEELDFMAENPALSSSDREEEAAGSTEFRDGKLEA